MTIKVMFVLMLFLNGNLIEFMGHHENEKGEWVEMGVPGCLAMKRTLSRTPCELHATPQKYIGQKERAKTVEPMSA